MLLYGWHLMWRLKDEWINGGRGTPELKSIAQIFLGDVASAVRNARTFHRQNIFVSSKLTLHVHIRVCTITFIISSSPLCHKYTFIISGFYALILTFTRSCALHSYHSLDIHVTHTPLRTCELTVDTSILWGL